ncbi:Ig-like domain-containing protein [uncultured Robinsoniella sp.]|uniref:Ig-like domain-containing protein n=1 Tax=uncultured Robinsoniella sp. TaxID=904190 RepID=UPI00374F432B
MKKKIALLLSVIIAFQGGFISYASNGQEERTFNEPDPLYETFQVPPFESKSRPLWFWNSPTRSLSDITKEDIREIMVRSKEESGYQGFGILPNWLDNYMSDQYLELYGYALETAEELGMKMCLYDEDGFPSGPAGGLLEAKYPQATLKRLDKQEKDVDEEGEVTVRIPQGEYRTYLGAVAMNNDTKEIINISDQAVIYEENGPGVYASSFHPAIGDQHFTAEEAFDGDLNTRWNSASGKVEDQWLEAYFPEAVTIDKIEVYEALGRINEYQLQYDNGTEWVELCAGTVLGDFKEIRIPQTTAQRFRLVVHNRGGADNEPVSIKEVKLFNGSSEVMPPQNTDKSYDHVTWNAPGGSWKIMTFASVKDDTNSRGLVDYLSKESVDEFIEITHDVYYENFPQYFGTVIDSAFYDEPPLYHAQGRTWTGKFNELFEESKGYNPITLYPALWYDIGEDTASARSELYSFRTDLFATQYIKNMNDWCNSHGIKLTGHMDQEENVNPVQSSGDMMKVFKYQDIPGVDEISYYDRALKAYKIVSSSANNWDKGLVMSETYGAMGEGMGISVLYKDVMNQFTRGINYVVPHAIWQNNTQAVDNPPELSYRSEQYGPELPAYNEYIGRVQGLLQEGSHKADIGVLYPIDTLEAHTVFGVGDPYMGVAPEEADYMEVGEYLMSAIRKDYTFLHPEVVAENCSVDGSTFHLNNETYPESYKMIVMPGAKTISLDALKKVKEFYDAGGQVIATTQLPSQSAEPGKNQEVVDIITAMFGITPEEINPELPVIHYSASSSFSDNYGPEKAFDKIASDGSRWNAGDLSGGDQWLMAEFEEEVTVEKVVIKENNPYRTLKFRVQYWDGSTWQDAASGTEIGQRQEVRFNQPVTTNKIRLYIDTIVSDSVSIQEFEIYGETGFNLACPKDYPIGLGDQRNDNGGRAVFLGGNYTETFGKCIDEMLPVADVTVENVSDQLPGGSFTYIHKMKDGRDVYYFVNSSDETVESMITLRGRMKKPMLWDPKTGEQKPADFKRGTKNGEEVTIISLTLDSIQSAFIMDSFGDVEVPLKSISLDKTTLNFKRGDTSGMLKVNYNPADTTDNKQILWESGNEKVAVVKDGVVTPVGPGSTVITAKSVIKGIETTCKVSVDKDFHTVPVKSIQLNPKSAALFTKEKIALKAEIQPQDATCKDVTWISGDSRIASVDKNGAVTGVKAGKTTITAVTADGNLRAACQVTVKQRITGMKFKIPAYTVTKRGQTVNLKKFLVISPKDASSRELSWKSGNKKTATVDKNGKVKFRASKGRVTITANSRDGSKKSAKITLVLGKRISKLKMNESSVALKKGKYFKLKADIVKPENPAYKKLIWSSGNSKVAKVDGKGKVKAVGRGKTTITATAGDGSGKKVKCKIEVK